MRLVIPLAVVLLVLCTSCWGEEQPPMTKADDLAKEELFLLGSFPQLLSGIKGMCREKGRRRREESESEVARIVEYQSTLFY